MDTCTQVFTALDDIGPDISACGPYADTVECGSEDYAQWVFAVVTDLFACATDNCGNFTVNPDSLGFAGGCGNTGSYLWAFTITDACGNTSSIVGEYTIVDTTPPCWSSRPELPELILTVPRISAVLLTSELTVLGSLPIVEQQVHTYIILYSLTIAQTRTPFQPLIPSLIPYLQ